MKAIPSSNVCCLHVSYTSSYTKILEESLIHILDEAQVYTLTLKLHTNTDAKVPCACVCACMHACIVSSDTLTSRLIMI